MNKCKCGCGNEVTKETNTWLLGHSRRGIKLFGDKNPFYGKKHNKETIQKMSKSATGRKHSEATKLKLSKQSTGRCAGEEHYNWKGGKDQYFHDKARDLFGKDNCEYCDIKLEDYKKLHNNKLSKFDMHNTVDDYSNFEEGSWKCLCRKCHRILHG